MIGKKINQLATELAPVSTDLTIIGDPTTGVSKKITLAQLGAIFSGAVSFYTNLAAFPNPGTIDVIYCAKDTKKLYLWSGSAYVEVFPSQALLDTYQLRSEKGVSNGYASLDSGGKVPISQLPSSIMEYKGTWNAATNTPTLANGTGDTGDVYLCNVAGSVDFGAGPITFAVGDYVIYSGSIWQRSSGAVGTVTSVAASITGDAIGITGSPITTSGTLALAFAGNSTQYVNGAGNLVTFPGIINEAQNLITEVYNKTGATLTKGTIVYINGGQGNLPTVTKALATGDSTSAQTYGIVRNDITNNNNGYVVVAGRISDLDTQAYTEGTQLYLSPTTAGTYTSTKPYAPQHLVYVGIVVRAHPTQGVVEVKIQNGYELDELHNVSAQSPTNNDGIFYNSATSLWEKKSIATVLGYTPQAQLNGTGFVKASGTTISYDNSTYVTIDTFENITASKNFTVGLSLGAAGGGNQVSVFANTNSIHSGSAGTNIFGFNSSNNIYFGKGSSNGGVIIWNNSTARYYTLPDADGTIALVGGSGVGSVTSVAALTLGTSGTDLSSTVANSTTTPVITLNVPTASATNRGALSSADWASFNSKQNAITLTTTGTSGAATLVGATLNIPNYTSGLTGYVPYTGATTNVNLGTNNLTAAVITGTSGTFSGAVDATQFSALNTGTSNPNFYGTGQIVSVASSQSTLYLDTTWNTTGNPEGIYFNVTNTASGSSSNLINLKVNNVSQFLVAKDGSSFFRSNMEVLGAVTAAGFFANNTGTSASNFFGSGQVVAASSSSNTLYLDATWNTTGNPEAIYLNISNTASGATSKLINLKVDNISQFNISKTGVTTLPNLSGTGTRMVVADASGVLSTQAVGSGAVTGTGTTNYLPKFTGTSTIGNSQIFDNGTQLAINTASPSGFGTQRFLVVSSAASQVARFTDGTNGDLVFDFPSSSVSRITAQFGTGGNLVFANGTGFTERMRLDASGNLGLGVTPSAWNSGYKVMDVSAWGSIAGEFGTQGTISLVSNCFANSTGYNNWTYVNTAPATRYKQYNGEHQWFTAPLGSANANITFTQAMTLNASGFLGIGDTSPAERLSVAGAIMSTGAITGHGANRTTLSQEGANGAFWQSYGANTTTVGTFTLRQASSDFSVVRSPLIIATTGAATFSSTVFVNGNTVGNGTLSITKNSTFNSEGSAGIVINSTNSASNTELLIGTDGTNNLAYIQTAAQGTSYTSKNLSLQPNGGNVGIGTTSPAALLHLAVANASVDGTKGVRITNPAGTTVMLECGVSSDSFVGTISVSDFQIRTGNTERMRITSGGNVGIGLDNPNNRLEVSLPSGSNGQIIRMLRSAGAYAWGIGIDGANSNFHFYNNGGTSVANINNSTGAYTATSDQRLKENILYSQAALDKVLQLKVRQYDWKNSGIKESYGFIAQELFDVLPQYVSKGNDTTNWGVAKAELVPMLVKAIQELKAELDTLKNK